MATERSTEVRTFGDEAIDAGERAGYPGLFVGVAPDEIVWTKNATEADQPRRSVHGKRVGMGGAQFRCLRVGRGDRIVCTR